MNVDSHAKLEPPEWAALQRLRPAYDDYSNLARGWARRGQESVGDDACEMGPPSKTTPRASLTALEPTQFERLDVGADIRTSAVTVQRALDGAGVHVDRVVRTAAGGVAFYFFGADTLEEGSHRRYASIEIDENGELTALHKDRVTGAAEVVDVPEERTLAEAIAAVSMFLQG